MSANRSVGAMFFALPPSITALRQSASRWRRGSRLPFISRKHKRPPVGTVFSFALNEPARVTLTFTQHRRGHKRHRSVRVAGSLGLSAHQGTSRIHFAGRLTRKRKLAPGRYVLTLTATNPAGQQISSRPLSFTIVR